MSGGSFLWEVQMDFSQMRRSKTCNDRNICSTSLLLLLLFFKNNVEKGLFFYVDISATSGEHRKQKPKMYQILPSPNCRLF